MVYIANWVILCYLPPIEGTRKLHWQWVIFRLHLTDIHSRLSKALHVADIRRKTTSTTQTAGKTQLVAIHWVSQCVSENKRNYMQDDLKKNIQTSIQYKVFTEFKRPLTINVVRSLGCDGRIWNRWLKNLKESMVSSPSASLDMEESQPLLLVCQTVMDHEYSNKQNDWNPQNIVSKS